MYAGSGEESGRSPIPRSSSRPGPAASRRRRRGSAIPPRCRAPCGCGREPTGPCRRRRRPPSRCRRGRGGNRRRTRRTRHGPSCTRRRTSNRGGSPTARRRSNPRPARRARRRTRRHHRRERPPLSRTGEATARENGPPPPPPPGRGRPVRCPRAAPAACAPASAVPVGRPPNRGRAERRRWPGDGRRTGRLPHGWHWASQPHAFTPAGRCIRPGIAHTGCGWPSIAGTASATSTG